MTHPIEVISVTSRCVFSENVLTKPAGASYAQTTTTCGRHTVAYHMSDHQQDLATDLVKVLFDSDRRSLCVTLAAHDRSPDTLYHSVLSNTQLVHVNSTSAHLRFHLCFTGMSEYKYSSPACCTGYTHEVCTTDCCLDQLS